MNDFINGYFTTSAAKITTADHACCVKRIKRKEKNSEIRASEINVVTGGVWWHQLFPGDAGKW